MGSSSILLTYSKATASMHAYFLDEANLDIKKQKVPGAQLHVIVELLPTSSAPTSHACDTSMIFDPLGHMHMNATQTSCDSGSSCPAWVYAPQQVIAGVFTEA